MSFIIHCFDETRCKVFDINTLHYLWKLDGFPRGSWTFYTASAVSENGAEDFLPLGEGCGP